MQSWIRNRLWTESMVWQRSGLTRMVMSPLCVSPTDRKLEGSFHHRIESWDNSTSPSLPFASVLLRCLQDLDPHPHSQCRQWQGGLSVSVSEALVNHMLESASCQGALRLGDISLLESCTSSPALPRPEISDAHVSATYK